MINCLVEIGHLVFVSLESIIFGRLSRFNLVSNTVYGVMNYIRMPVEHDGTPTSQDASQKIFLNAADLLRSCVERNRSRKALNLFDC